MVIPCFFRQWYRKGYLHHFFQLAFFQTLFLIQNSAFAVEDAYDDWSLEALIEYRDQQRAEVMKNAMQIAANERQISEKRQNMSDHEGSAAGSAFTPLNCSNGTAHHQSVNKKLQEASKVFSYISGAATVIGPGTELVHNYVAHYRKELPVPQSGYGWLLFDEIGNIIFIAHFTFDWLNGDDNYSSYIGNIVPSMMMITIDTIGLITLSIFHMRLKRLKKPENRPLLEVAN